MAPDSDNDQQIMDLPNKPLAEALLEIRWKLEEKPGGVTVDKGYPFVAGRLYDRVSVTYPEIEELPASRIPDEITPHVVKYRYRTAKDAWPVVQVGPGIATLNFTKSYTWDRFYHAVVDFVPKLIDAYKPVDRIQPESVLLRYINTINFDATKDDVARFLKEKMHTEIVLPPGIANYAHSDGPVHEINLQLVQPLTRPKGVGLIRIVTGVRDEVPVLLWELHVTAKGEHAPRLDGGFDTWLTQGHEVIESWFFTLIEGELQTAFSKESAE